MNNKITTYDKTLYPTFQDYYMSKQYRKDYYHNNKEKIAEKAKKYYEENKEMFLKKRKEYCDNNKEKEKERHKKYYENNKEKIVEKIKCECGCMISRIHISRHRKSKKHIELIENKLL